MNLRSRMMIALSTTLTLLILLLCIGSLPTTAYASPSVAQSTGTTTTLTIGLHINGGALATTAPSMTLSASSTNSVSPVTRMHLYSPSDTTDEWNVFVPLISKTDAATNVCAPIEGESYAAITPDTSYPDGDPPPEQHPDLNLSVRSYEPNPDAYLGLVDYAGDFDPAAPQLYGLFADERTPAFGTQYQMYDWLWKECNCRGKLLTDYPATLSGMKVSPGEPIHVPPSGYSIGTFSNAYEVLVLYASENQITLKYTRNDDVIEGYTIKVEGVCVEPRLLELYNQWHDAGRTRLPALRAGQAFGRAKGEEIRVAIRDSGTFMDPRSRKDWWQGRQATFSIPRKHVPPSAEGQ